ncbi:MAG: metal-sulfur cluster assembly factor [Nitrososphaerales archaeon]
MADLKAKVIEALKNCYDPEIPINIVDLGLIYDLKVEDGDVKIKMILTAPGCPMGFYLVEQVKEAVSAVEGVKNVDVMLVNERWTPDRMSAEARRNFNL